MRPGTTYTMGVLAEQYGASRTPMRDALLELEARGLVEITRGVGFSVCALSPKEWADAIAVREMLEVPAMKSLAGELSPADIAKARSILKRIERAASANDILGYLEYDEQFHLFLIGLTGNAKLAQIVGMLRDMQRFSGLAIIAAQGHLGSRHIEHIEILEAIEAGDMERVGELVSHHLAISKTVYESDQ
jgi:DNA-binding GntR family transcriptional regulator